MRVTEVPKPMRWTVLVALSAATALIYMVSLRGNYLYGYSLGQTSEKRELFAWANVAADIWKGFGLVAVLLLWRNNKRMSLVALVAWIICVATGVNSAIGVYVQDRAALTGSREAKHVTFKDVEHELAEVEQRLASLAPHRSVQQVEAAIAAILAKPFVASERIRGTVGSLSGDCTKMETRTAEACANVASLRQELAVAFDALGLEKETKRLRADVRNLRDHGGSLAPDPVGEFWAWATGGLLSVRDVGFGFPLFFAFLIEIVSAFGPAVIVSLAAATRTDGSLSQPAAARSSRMEQAVSFLEGPTVAHWLADRTEPTSNPAAITIQELFADYASWCANTGVLLHALDAFTDEFDRMRTLPELATKIRKFGNRYYGLRLVRARAVRQIASANDG